MDAAAYERRRQTRLWTIRWAILGCFAILPGVYLSHLNMSSQLDMRPDFPVPEAFSFKLLPTLEPTLLKQPSAAKQGQDR
jgi:hypothetical protein